MLPFLAGDACGRPGGPCDEPVWDERWGPYCLALDRPCPALPSARLPFFAASRHTCRRRYGAPGCRPAFW